MDESNRDFGWVADQRIDDGGGLPRGWAKAADAYGAIDGVRPGSARDGFAGALRDDGQPAGNDCVGAAGLADLPDSALECGWPIGG